MCVKVLCYSNLLQNLAVIHATLLILLCCYFTEASQNQPLTPDKANQSLPADGLSLYRKLFKVKRKEHIAAVQKLIIEENVEKQAKLIQIMMDAIVKTIHGAQSELIKKAPEMQGFPQELHLKDALAQVVENTALFADLIVRFPTPGHVFYKKNRKTWKPIMDAAIKTCNSSGVYEGDHQLVLYSLKQELGIGDRDPKYENPFKVKVDPQNELTSEERQELYEAAKRKKKMQDRKNKRKGARTVKHQEL